MEITLIIVFVMTALLLNLVIVLQPGKGSGMGALGGGGSTAGAVACAARFARICWPVLSVLPAVPAVPGRTTRPPQCVHYRCMNSHVPVVFACLLVVCACGLGCALPDGQDCVSRQEGWQEHEQLGVALDLHEGAGHHRALRLVRVVQQSRQPAEDEIKVLGRVDPREEVPEHVLRRGG